MAFPTTSVLDNFNRADGALGTNWSLAYNYFGAGDPTISGNVVVCGTGYHVMYWNALTPGADQESYIDVPTKWGSIETPSEGVAVECRMANYAQSTWRGYEVMVLSVTGTGNDTWHVNRIDDHVATQLGATVTREYADGDSVGIEAIGTTIKAYHKSGGTWTEVASRTDSTYNDGGIGFYAGRDATNWQYDNFGGGTVVGGAATPVWVPRRMLLGVG